MRRLIALLLLAMILTAGMASAHRMFVGHRVNVETYAMFDDGTPAQNAPVKVYRNGELYAENVTDSSGMFALTLPGKGTGEWSFEVSAGGHREETFINISDEKSDAKTAGVAALAVMPLAIIAWRGRKEKGR